MDPRAARRGAGTFGPARSPRVVAIGARLPTSPFFATLVPQSGAVFALQASGRTARAGGDILRPDRRTPPSKPLPTEVSTQQPRSEIADQLALLALSTQSEHRIAKIGARDAAGVELEIWIWAPASPGGRWVLRRMDPKNGRLGGDHHDLLELARRWVLRWDLEEVWPE